MSRRQRNKPADAAPAPPPESRRRARLVAQTPPPATIRQPRTLAVGLGSIVSVLVLLGLLAAWSIGMTLILLFGDRMSDKLITQSSEMQDSYEQRLQGYRAEIARLALEIEQSRFDQTSVEGRVVEMGRRQRLIEARLQALKRLSDLVGTAPGGPPTLTPGGAAPAGPAPAPAAPQPPAKRTSFGEDSPAPEAPVWTAPLDEGTASALIHKAQLGAPPAVEQAPTPISDEMEQFLQRMDRALTNAEQTETQILQGFNRSFEGRVERTRGAMSLLGLTPEAVLHWRGRSDIVLPNIILPLSDQQTPFGLAVARVRQNYGILYGFKPVIDQMPVTRPTATDVRYSSGFGYRKHPLLGTQRLHAGIDMAAPIGTVVRAAGSGTVISAGWGGGYGNLVQIDHGNGLITRYAHLSRIDVSPQQPIGRGQVVGLMGTTGQSTGSHLHFETRIQGNPVNPACFMLAGDRILGAQPIPYACEESPRWSSRKSSEDEDDDS